VIGERLAIPQSPITILPSAKADSPAVKTIRLVLLAALLAVPVATRADDNRYTVLGQVLMPFANVFAKNTKNPNRALQFSGRIELMTGLPPALVGSRAELAMEYPDKLRLRAPILGEEITVCRRGQEVWAYPGSRVRALLEVANAGKKLAKPDPKAQLPPFTLPVPESQLALLPVLFQVKDVGAEELDGAPCRVMDLFLMPELAKSLRQKDWAARVWVRDDKTPARLSIARTDSQFAFRFERVTFSKKLPPETWKPTAEQAGDILKLDAARYTQLIEALAK
jgi:hypothetical protein